MRKNIQHITLENSQKETPNNNTTTFHTAENIEVKPNIIGHRNKKIFVPQNRVKLN